MSNPNFLKSPRKLTKIELLELGRAQNKWFPTIIQTYRTSLFEMMASPYKKTFIYFMILFIIGLFIIGLFLNQTVFKNKIAIGMILFVISCICFFIGIEQYRLNDNLLLILTLTKPNANKYDYESSSVIQNQLLRKAYRGGNSNNGILGGIIGAGLSIRDKNNKME